MKLQIEGQHLRVRIDEDELALLLADGVVTARTQFADAFVMGVELRLTHANVAKFAGQASGWTIDLPQAAVREHASRLPTREGLRFILGESGSEDELTLLFDVDVRDSVRRRKLS
jgi:hypothetical protein